MYILNLSDSDRNDWFYKLQCCFLVFVITFWIIKYNYFQSSTMSVDSFVDYVADTVGGERCV